MRRNAALRRRWICLLLAVILAIGLLPLDSAFTAFAQGIPSEMANVVVFVRLRGAMDDFADPANWTRIKGQFDDDKYSFSNYIEIISGGRLRVKNIFPQVRTNGEGKAYILSYELPQSSYDAYGGGLGGGADAALIDDVVKALAEAQDDASKSLYLDPALKLDNREPGVLDNLTIVLQGATFNGGDHSFKGNYSGEAQLRGLRVSCYNAMPSGNLINVTDPDGGMQYAGFGGQGVIAHEFLHTLGLPDLYRLGGNGEPVGPWDIMSSAAYTLQYPLGYQRGALGWLAAEEQQEITQSGDYTLTAVDQPGGVKLITIKTPMSESSTETICIEYRKQNAEYHAIEWRLPGTGLLMYRVDDKVEDHTNISGKNYIYVYRPGATTQEDAADTETITTGSSQSVTRNRVYGAALGSGSYGSTDLSADFTQNTLYYSTGRNSGIQISNLQFSGNTVAFHVEFAQYGDTWKPLGGTAATSVITPRLYADEASGALYLAFLDQSQQIRVNQWDAASGVWQSLGGTVGAAHSASGLSLAACGGILYTAFWDTSGYPVVSRWSGGAWSAPSRIGDVQYPMALQLVTDDSGLYAAYEDTSDSNAHRIVIRDLNGGVVAVSPMAAQSFCNPTVVKDGSKFYIAYSKFAEGSPAQIDAYDTATQSWQPVYTYRSARGSANLLTAKGGRLYALTGSVAMDSAGTTPTLALWDGNGWTEKEVPGAENFYEINITVAGQTPYVSFSDQGENKARMLRLSGGEWENCYDGLNGAAEYFQAVNIGTQVYAAVKAPHTGTVNVFAQQVTLAPDDPTQPGQPTDPVTPPPTDPDQPMNPADPNAALTLRLTPPAGYTDTKIYVDGVAYDARQENGLAVPLPDANGRIATMYYYNERGVPKGMYVWRLGHDGAAYTATPLPGLQDLISYHGFSIRVQSPAGIRFKSGIDTGLRAQLLAGGVDGYTLTEYGTISIDVPSQGPYTLIKGAAGVRGGRSYWTQDGIVNDRIFEMMEGRYRFTSVLIGVPEQVYATDMAYRAYVILRDVSGAEVTVYGPPVARSIYTVAKQVAAAGEFKPGSGGYQYIQGIIQAVEK